MFDFFTATRLLGAIKCFYLLVPLQTIINVSSKLSVCPMLNQRNSTEDIWSSCLFNNFRSFLFSPFVYHPNVNKKRNISHKLSVRAKFQHAPLDIAQAEIPHSINLYVNSLSLPRFRLLMRSSLRKMTI